MFFSTMKGGINWHLAKGLFLTLLGKDNLPGCGSQIVEIQLWNFSILYLLNPALYVVFFSSFKYLYILEIVKKGSGEIWKLRMTTYWKKRVENALAIE